MRKEEWENLKQEALLCRSSLKLFFFSLLYFLRDALSPTSSSGTAKSNDTEKSGTLTENETPLSTNVPQDMPKRIVEVKSNKMYRHQMNMKPMRASEVRFPVIGNVCGKGPSLNRIEGHVLFKPDEKWFCLQCGWVPNDNAQKACEYIFMGILEEQEQEQVSFYNGEMVN